MSPVKNSLRALVLLLSCTALGLAQPGSTGSPNSTISAPPILSLDQALEICSRSNRMLQSDSHEIERQQALYEAQAAQRLPKLAATYQYSTLLTPINFGLARGALGTFASVGPIPAQDISISNIRGTQSNVQVTLTQPLTQLHKLSLGMESQEQEVEIARSAAAAERLSMANSVRQVYFGLVDTRNAVQALKESVAFASEVERVTQEYLKQKAVLKRDLLEVQSSLAQQVYQLKTTENSYRLQKQQLNHLLGRPLDIDFEVAIPTISPEVREALLELQNLAQQERPDLVKARARLKQALLSSDQERARYIPDVGLQFGYQNNTNSGLLPGSIMHVALIATWDIFDWGSRDAAILAREKQSESAQLQLEEARSKAALDVSAKFHRYQDIQALEPVRALQVQAAEEKHRVAQARYQVKSVLSKDLLESQYELTGARRNYLKWKLDLAMAVAELYQAIGRNP